MYQSGGTTCKQRRQSGMTHVCGWSQRTRYLAVQQFLKSISTLHSWTLQLPRPALQQDICKQQTKGRVPLVQLVRGRRHGPLHPPTLLPARWLGWKMCHDTRYIVLVSVFNSDANAAGEFVDGWDKGVAISLLNSTSRHVGRNVFGKGEIRSRFILCLVVSYLSSWC